MKGYRQSHPQTQGLVLLHGLFRTKRSMRRMEVEGVRRGYEVLNVGYPSRKFCVEDLSQRVLVQIQEWQEKHQIKHLCFITHSMGGILLRQMATVVSKSTSCRAVLLGPPNQGSELADFLGNLAWYRWLNGPAGMELGTSSVLLMETEAAQCIDIGVIAGTRSSDPLGGALLPVPNDGRVTVERTKLLGMKDHLVLPVTHTFMMNDSRVIQASFKFLKEMHF